MPDTKDHGHGHDNENPNPAHGHEKTDANVMNILKFGFWMVVAAFVIQGGMWVMLRYYVDAPEEKQNEPPSPLLFQNSRVPPKPRLQDDPVKDLQIERNSENASVNSYEWVDKSTGTVKLPIDEAVKRLAEKGLPSRPNPPQGVKDDGQNMPEDSSSGRTSEHRLR